MSGQEQATGHVQERFRAAGWADLSEPEAEAIVGCARELGVVRYGKPTLDALDDLIDVLVQVSPAALGTFIAPLESHS